VIGGMWRWAWTAGVFGVFFLVVGTALESAPPADGEPPLIEAGDTPIKERVALPDIGEVVPRSSVLNLLADGEDAATVEAETLAALEAEVEQKAARRQEAARTEAALQAVTPGEPAPAAPSGEAGPPRDGAGTSTVSSAPADDVGEPPLTAVPEPNRRPETPPRAGDADGQAAAPAAGPVEDEPGTPVAARTTAGAFRIQLAAVPPGEEHATFARLERRFGAALDGLAPRFQAISTEDGVLVRVQAAGFASEAAAAAQCRRIRAAGGDCFVVAGSG
jgi:hypothetical protein